MPAALSLAKFMGVPPNRDANRSLKTSIALRKFTIPAILEQQRAPLCWAACPCARLVCNKMGNVEKFAVAKSCVRGRILASWGRTAILSHLTSRAQVVCGPVRPRCSAADVGAKPRTAARRADGWRDRRRRFRLRANGRGDLGWPEFRTLGLP